MTLYNVGLTSKGSEDMASEITTISLLPPHCRLMHTVHGNLSNICVNNMLLKLH